MYKIKFYRDIKGRVPVLEYMQELTGKKGKDSKIRLKKIQEYMSALEQRGTLAGEPYIKPIRDGLWELRPSNDRIFFVGWHNGCYVLLHHCMKKTQKTPTSEIDRAEREIADLQERGDTYGE